jgi:hypothetical protein
MLDELWNEDRLFLEVSGLVSDDPAVLSDVYPTLVP